ncbi:hypothetical protein F443_17431 [Phytophthora nicotianae P1569]|uniref:Uncharacterized protein n=1 Tax=Phytophthora nicotianae P1569 TaxID=1317065 RepID=V9EBJ1_PHYNI|nr:hypothetical protein F443_17431 [Phytophthora nicotianae P1569]
MLSVRQILKGIGRLFTRHEAFTTITNRPGTFVLMLLSGAVLLTSPRNKRR